MFKKKNCNRLNGNNKKTFEEMTNGGSGAAEKPDLPQTHLPRRGPRLAGVPVPAAEQLMQPFGAWWSLNPGLRRALRSLLKPLHKAKEEAWPTEKSRVEKEVGKEPRGT